MNASKGFAPGFPTITPGTRFRCRCLLDYACSAQHTILDEGRIAAARHPDAFLEQNTINPTETKRKYWKAFFKTKELKMDETNRIYRTILIFFGSKVGRTLVKDNFLIDFFDQQLENRHYRDV